MHFCLEQKLPNGEATKYKCSEFSVTLRCERVM